MLTDDEIATGVGQSVNNGIEYMFYRMPYHWSMDYQDIRCFLANKYPTMTAPDPVVDNILKTSDFPIIEPGNYPIIMEYVLPGKNIVTTSKYIELKNNIRLSF